MTEPQVPQRMQADTLAMLVQDGPLLFIPYVGTYRLVSPGVSASARFYVSEFRQTFRIATRSSRCYRDV